MLEHLGTKLQVRLVQPKSYKKFYILGLTVLHKIAFESTLVLYCFNCRYLAICFCNHIKVNNFNHKSVKWCFTSAVLLGSTLAAPPGPAEASAMG